MLSFEALFQEPSVDICPVIVDGRQRLGHIVSAEVAFEIPLVDLVELVSVHAWMASPLVALLEIVEVNVVPIQLEVFILPLFLFLLPVNLVGDVPVDIAVGIDVCTALDEHRNSPHLRVIVWILINRVKR